MEFTQEYLLLGDTIQVRYYGIIIVFALLVGAFVASILARRDGRDPDHIWGGLTWAIIPGIILARLWFVFFPPAELIAGCATEDPNDICQNVAWFMENFFDTNNGAIAIWNGGLSIFGALIGGLIGVWLYLSSAHNKVYNLITLIFTPVLYVWGFLTWIPRALQQRVNGDEVTPYKYQRPQSDFPEEGMAMAPWLDIAAVGIPIAQAIGRLANYINQELYGSPTNLPWGIGIDRDHRVPPYLNEINYPVEGANQTLFHPLWAYEAIWNIITFVILWILFNNHREKLHRGDIFLLYVIFYAPIRFLLEFLRVSPAYLPGTSLNSSQTITGLAFVVALLIFLYRHRPGTSIEREDLQPAVEV